jgi:hypothetical protein
MCTNSGKVINLNAWVQEYDVTANTVLKLRVTQPRKSFAYFLPGLQPYRTGKTLADFQFNMFQNV